jgi:hypothetical protein
VALPVAVATFLFILDKNEKFIKLLNFFQDSIVQIVEKDKLNFIKKPKF